MSTPRIDVVIAGAGPAGTTAANLLARAGVRVIGIERDRFPRFHIGESLLPIDATIYDRIGFEPQGGTYLRKAGAEFIDEREGHAATYFFRDALPGGASHAWQVERSRFDLDLAELARSVGAELHFEERVSDLNVHPDHVEVLTSKGSYIARYFIDATGQDAWLGRRQRSLVPIDGFGKVAVAAHWTGLRPDAVAELESTGNIRILIVDEGWGWLIPLAGGKLSQGYVTTRRGVEVDLLDELHERSALSRRLTEGATRSEPFLIRNFAYANQQAGSSRVACIGDAAGFLDPVFSSGVALAMQGAAALVDRLLPALEAGTEDAPDLAKPPREHMRHAYESFGSLVHSFYHTNLVRHVFFNDDPDPRLRSELISLLAGDVWRDDNGLQRSLRYGRRGWKFPG